jgi:23S rRNA (adenine2030-N6)-methyltransferase
MLSYRHGFHAGNHADVLKHLILVATLRHLVRKAKPCVYVDTHAGAGRYSLGTPSAARTGEAAQGIRKLWDRGGLPEPVADYVSLIHAFNPAGHLGVYPGSPLLASRVLRPTDRMHLCELHPADWEGLSAAVRGLPLPVRVERTDGLATLKSLLPPVERRGVVMIDPSYENKADYGGVVRALRDAEQRFATGVYLVWLPLLPRLEARELPQRLQRGSGRPWLHASLAVRRPSPGGGLYGSGVFVVNPPWTLAAALREALPWLAETLAQDDAAQFSLEEGGIASG